MKTLLVISIIILFLAPASGYVGNTIFEKEEHGQKTIAEFNHTVEIAPGDDYYIHFSPSGIEEKQISYAHNLSQKAQAAIARSPLWLQRELAKQFYFLDERYADLLLSTEKKYVDEIAFSIAYSPVGAVPPPEVLYDNARFLYENDRFLDYVDIIDEGNGSDYYSTLEYKVLENGTEKKVICPPSIYYWFVVSPRATIENATYVYGKFWREYVFNHNDIGYPLLKEKLSGIKYMWDCKSYRPPAHRTWNYSMSNHPTAVEAVNYWVGKTIPALATGDRPGQPNVVAHEHNGFCGEIHELSTAALRAALIPAVPINCLGEDHVWCEFWERGWHEFDEWWADGGGSIDNFDEYRYGWNKIMSALFALKGDSSIYDVTEHYIHEEDRGDVKVVVKDIFGNPVDGVRVTVFGSWKANNFKDKMWDRTVGKLWSKLPEGFREKWQENYTELREWYHERVPGIVPWIVPSIWNYTGVDGECTFHLGAGHSYLFSLQKDEIFYYEPFSLGESNALHYMVTIFPNKSRNVRITFVLPDGMPSFKKEHVVSPPEGNDYECKVKFSTSAYQIQRNIWDWEDGKAKTEYGREEVSSAVKFFIVDEENFGKYMEGKAFDCYHYIYSDTGNISFNTSKAFYLVFQNTAKRTTVITNISASFETSTGENFISIDKPWSDVFEKPTINVGDVVVIKGASTSEGKVKVADKTFDVDGKWKIYWNTSSLSPGDYEMVAKCGNFEKTYGIKLVDASPPAIDISHPYDGEIFDGNVVVQGRAYDNVGIESVDMEVAGEKISLPENFSYEWAPPGPGDYDILIRASDGNGLETEKVVHVVVNGSGNMPSINKVWYTPENPTNSSNLAVYANVTGGMFSIKKVEIEMNGEAKEMYLYASDPVQQRHDEDPLKNESNLPAYGIELGQFPSGSTIKFRVEAYDSAGNSVMSDEFTVRIS